MHDIKIIRENPQALDRALMNRGLVAQSAQILEKDMVLRENMKLVQELQAKRNELSQAVADLKKQGKPTDDVMAQVAEFKTKLTDGEAKVKKLADELNGILAMIPNIPLDAVPVGKDEHDNKEVRRWGQPKKFGFKPKSHDELGEEMGLMDFEAAATMSGARFVLMTGGLARLERAIGQFMLNTHTEKNGYRELSVPLLVNSNAVYGVAQLPKFAPDLFQTTDGKWLISTAEVSLTNYVYGKTLEEDQLPMRITALTPCFRSEAGAAGKDTRGMIRQHQFYKTELVSITTQEQSLDELERMTGCAESILQALDLPYRVITLCTGDMGFASAKTYDIEVWLPSQECYREISSCSVCTDFQARRMNARYKPKGEKGAKFVHTLNGSGVAVGRTLVAIMENYQNADGSITIPEVLRPYMNGLDVIQAVAKK